MSRRVKVLGAQNPQKRSMRMREAKALGTKQCRDSHEDKMSKGLGGKKPVGGKGHMHTLSEESGGKHTARTAHWGILSQVSRHKVVNKGTLRESSGENYYIGKLHMGIQSKVFRNKVVNKGILNESSRENHAAGKIHKGIQSKNFRNKPVRKYILSEISREKYSVEKVY